MTDFLQSVSLGIGSLDAARRVSAGIAKIRHGAGVVSVGRSSGATAGETRIPSSTKHVRILRLPGREVTGRFERLVFDESRG